MSDFHLKWSAEHAEHKKTLAKLKEARDYLKVIRDGTSVEKMMVMNNVEIIECAHDFAQMGIKATDEV